MAKIELRYQRVSDAKRFFEILQNPNFTYFSALPKTLEEEVNFIKDAVKKRKKGLNYDHTLLYNGKVVGAAGLNMTPDNKYAGDIGYFVDEEYWGKGIATKAVKFLEKLGFNKYKLKRIQIVANTKNKGSRKVAEKCGYKKEGIHKKAWFAKGTLGDMVVYAKIK